MLTNTDLRWTRDHERTAEYRQQVNIIRDEPKTVISVRATAAITPVLQNIEASWTRVVLCRGI